LAELLIVLVTPAPRLLTTDVMPLFRIDWIARAGEVTYACIAGLTRGVNAEPPAATVGTAPVAEPGETVMVGTTMLWARL
jgi:hypothetical protein